MTPTSFANILYFSPVDNLLVTASQVQRHSGNDPRMGKMMDMLLKGTIAETLCLQPDLKPYVITKLELNFQAGVYCGESE